LVARGANELSELSPEICSRLRVYADLIGRWQPKINLIGASTLGDIWVRHFEDSYQLTGLVDSWTEWVDMGSGAGLPALVVAMTRKGSERMHLIESDKRKAAFLREVSRETKTNVEIHVGRIEAILPGLCEDIRFDVVSARALAPLGRLIEYASPALQNGALGLFLKGKGLAAELTELSAANKLDIRIVDSRTDSDGRIVVVRAHDSQTDLV
jgi:16S rRNA (guanine527-N7)-methyltransferase